jgi:hypothetical protein
MRSSYRVCLSALGGCYWRFPAGTRSDKSNGKGMVAADFDVILWEMILDQNEACID